ncbi:hypothetical protein QWY84_17715 [Aquisalimonas lutea]|uniref:hypothetical protein n=1 Tax=Aquisalimonas lutea TaxID=1327750 RepID=UPI0025B34713|nr:hypothetical protein [Aquisalimonas lutea]MDN3519447.1 hypothetical protein [Aquisalimonas lutea]
MITNGEAKRHFLHVIHGKVVERMEEEEGKVQEGEKERDPHSDHNVADLGRLYAHVAAMPEGHILFSAWAKAWDLVGYEMLLPENTTNPAPFAGVRVELGGYREAAGAGEEDRIVFLRILVYLMIWFATGKELWAKAYLEVWKKDPLQVPGG